ncbi:MAG: acyltransferase family protein [Patescibacteria group bacterium]
MNMERAKTTKPAVKSTSKPYNAYLDVLKGFAIAMVVLGHSIQTSLPNGSYDDNILFRIIYSFHMPLFMFLSGAAAAYSLRPMNWKFLQRKFNMLVIPFFAWYVVSYFLGDAYKLTSFPTYIHKFIVSPDNGLWFLWILFLNFVALAVIKKLSGRIGLISYPLVWLAIFAVPTGQYGIGLVKWHLPFFAVGYLIFLYREALARYRRPVLYLCAISFPLLVASWHRLYLPSVVTDLNVHLSAHHLATINIGDIITLNTYQLASMVYLYLVPFAGIGFFYWLFQVRPNKYVYSFFGFLGIYTLDIYVSQMYFFRFAFGPTWLAITTGFIFGLVGSLALGMFVLRRVPILSTIFLGGRAKVVVPRIKPLS